MSEKRDPAARDKAEAWLAGWQCGATFGIIPEKYQQNPHFTAGWNVGHQALNSAKEQVKHLYGIEFGVLYLADNSQ